VRAIHETLREIEPNSAEFAAMQRKYFCVCEKYLDAGYGPCPFRNVEVCELTRASLLGLSDRSGWTASDFTLMPNHVHLILEPTARSAPLKQTIRGWKWHVAKEANKAKGTAGHFWQSDWFDRWARTEGEAARMREYVRQNPVKARIVAQWQDHPWTHSSMTQAASA
jgi:putative transposase